MMLCNEEALERQGLIVREGLATDEAFIFNSWLNSIWNDVEGLKRSVMKKDYFYAGHHQLLTNLYPRLSFKVITQKKDQDHILAFLAYEGMKEAIIYHYLFVKAVYRGYGLARFLLQLVLDQDKEQFYTHRNGYSKVQAPEYHIQFNPYLFYTTERNQTLCQVIEKRTHVKIPRSSAYFQELV